MVEGVQSGASSAKWTSRTSLAGTRLFASLILSAEEREALEFAASPMKPVRASVDIVREGEPSDQFHIITEGWACRYKTTAEGGRQIVAIMVPGDVANLDTLMFSRPDYGVQALTAAKIVAIPRDRALALAAEHPGIARSFTWLAMVENATLSQWALCLGRYSAQKRLAHLLCELGARVASLSDRSSTFELPLTQAQLGDALGLTAVHVNRTMQQLRTQNLVVAASRTITVPDMARLRLKAEFNPACLHIG